MVKTEHPCRAWYLFSLILHNIILTHTRLVKFLLAYTHVHTCTSTPMYTQSTRTFIASTYSYPCTHSVIWKTHSLTYTLIHTHTHWYTRPMHFQSHTHLNMHTQIKHSYTNTSPHTHTYKFTHTRADSLSQTHIEALLAANHPRTAQWCQRGNVQMKIRSGDYRILYMHIFFPGWTWKWKRPRTESPSCGLGSK